MKAIDKNTLVQSLRSATVGKWVKCTLALGCIIAFAFWISNFWILLLLPFFFDIYITKIIPWSWWKNSPDKRVKQIMGWVDAIVFALVAVYFINIYLVQNYKIPSSSLEKTLLVGDYLLVSKFAYGPRVPNTPLSFPLAQHTLPIFNCKSYIENPQWPYKRLKGLGQVERNDIVVFNFPAGDTVALNMQNPDYYTLCALYSRDRVTRDKKTFGEIVSRPVDRRENYVKRCLGLPGDTFQIVNNKIYINGSELPPYKGVQLNYLVQTDGRLLSEEQFRMLDVSQDDRMLINGLQNGDQVLDWLHFSRNSTGLHNPVYHFPLTASALSTLKGFPFVTNVKVEPDSLYLSDVYPLGAGYGWTRDNYGPFWIPQKGSTLILTPQNYAMYERVIRNYERHTFEWLGDKALIDGQPTDRYTFSMDYYWMMGDNRHNSADSRSWGFVPEDHIVGAPLLIWLSIDKDRSLFDGKIRLNRILKTAKAVEK